MRYFSGTKKCQMCGKEYRYPDGGYKYCNNCQDYAEHTRANAMQRRLIEREKRIAELEKIIEEKNIKPKKKERRKSELQLLLQKEKSETQAFMQEFKAERRHKKVIPKNTIAKVNKMAREEGMTYGQYMATHPEVR